MYSWFYDEKKHCGVNYADAKEAEKYEERHDNFRDFKKEFSEMLKFLSLAETRDKTIIDLGCGPGIFSDIAAQHFKKVYAVDVSEEMIKLAKSKINAENVEFVSAGFLSYQHASEPVDLVISKVAFHHLPDFWKQAALFNINNMLKPGGIFYLHDVIFNFEAAEYKDKIDKWISNFKKIVGEKMQHEIAIHIKDEYSTFGWIIDNMLKTAGFIIKEKRTAEEFISEYYCIKK